MAFTKLMVMLIFQLIAFGLSLLAERRITKVMVKIDDYFETTSCVYSPSASTAYGFVSFVLLLIGHGLVHDIKNCLGFGKQLCSGERNGWAALFYTLSWVSFLGAEVLLLVGSISNSYRIKSLGIFGGDDLYCAAAPKHLFDASATFIAFSIGNSTGYHLSLSKIAGSGRRKHLNELEMTTYGNDLGV